MFDSRPGDQIVDLLRNAASEVIIVAPFIKIGAIRELLDCVNLKEVKFDCVTRWLAQDIVAGVCDIEIFDFIEGLPNSNLWMNMRLHAKYIRVDDRYLVGSANITASALGWRVPSNLELLIDGASNSVELKSWEQKLFESSVVVGKEDRDKLQERVSELATTGTKMHYVDFEVESGIDENWIPCYAEPAKLYSVYSKVITSENTPNSAYRFAVHDLNVLGIPANLLEDDFNLSVTQQLLKLGVFREILDSAKLGKEDGVDIETIRKITLQFEPDPTQCDIVAERIMEWVIHFFANEYKPEFKLARLVKSKRIKSI